MLVWICINFIFFFFVFYLYCVRKFLLCILLCNANFRIALCFALQSYDVLLTTLVNSENIFIFLLQRYEKNLLGANVFVVGGFFVFMLEYPLSVCTPSPYPTATCKQENNHHSQCVFRVFFHPNMDNMDSMDSMDI